MLKLTFNSSVLIRSEQLGLERALDRLKEPKVHFNSSPSLFLHYIVLEVGSEKFFDSHM